jgi:phosphopantetheinyl transferase (holo-ACP synthase)
VLGGVFIEVHCFGPSLRMRRPRHGRSSPQILHSTVTCSRPGPARLFGHAPNWGAPLRSIFLRKRRPAAGSSKRRSVAKPIARGGVERHVSISHTSSLVAAAVSAIGPIGIDVERRDRVRDFARLAAAAFGSIEAATVAAEGAAAFYRIWSVREAMSKATGDGLPEVVDRQDRVPPKLPDGKWIVGRDNWLLAHDVIKDGVSLALAVRSPLHEATTAMRAGSVADLRVRV